MSLLPERCPRRKKILRPRTSRELEIIKDKFDRIMKKEVDRLYEKKDFEKYFNRKIFKILEYFIMDSRTQEQLDLVRIVEFKENDKLFHAFKLYDLGPEGNLERKLTKGKELKSQKIFFGISPDIPVSFTTNLARNSIGEYRIRKNFSCLDLRVSKDELKKFREVANLSSDAENQVGHVMFLQELKVFKTLLFLNWPNEEDMLTLLSKLLQYKAKNIGEKHSWSAVGKFTSISMTALIEAMNNYIISFLKGKIPIVIGIIRQNIDLVSKTFAYPTQTQSHLHKELSEVVEVVNEYCFPELIIRADFILGQGGGFINTKANWPVAKINPVDRTIDAYPTKYPPRPTHYDVHPRDHIPLSDPYLEPPRSLSEAKANPPPIPPVPNLRRSNYHYTPPTKEDIRGIRTNLKKNPADVELSRHEAKATPPPIPPVPNLRRSNYHYTPPSRGDIRGIRMNLKKNPADVELSRHEKITKEEIPGHYKSSFFNKMANYSSVLNKTFFKK